MNRENNNQVDEATQRLRETFDEIIALGDRQSKERYAECLECKDARWVPSNDVGHPWGERPCRCLSNLTLKSELSRLEEWKSERRQRLRMLELAIAELPTACSGRVLSLAQDDIMAGVLLSEKRVGKTALMLHWMHRVLHYGFSAYYCRQHDLVQVIQSDGLKSAVEWVAGFGFFAIDSFDRFSGKSWVRDEEQASLIQLFDVLVGHRHRKKLGCIVVGARSMEGVSAELVELVMDTCENRKFTL